MRSLSLDRLEKERGVEDAIALWETARSLGKRKGDRPHVIHAMPPAGYAYALRLTYRKRGGAWIWERAIACSFWWVIANMRSS